MSTDFELFPGKNLSGLFKDIYENQVNKKQRISELIAEMKNVIRHAGDMAVIGPIIKDLVDTSVKNDDSLIKMAAIAQRIIGAQHKAEGDTGFLSDDEKEQLLKQLDETISQVADEQDVKVDELTNEVEELKQKVKLNEPENI
jgi:cytochrome c551/c552